MLPAISAIATCTLSGIAISASSSAAVWVARVLFWYFLLTAVPGR